MPPAYSRGQDRRLRRLGKLFLASCEDGARRAAARRREVVRKIGREKLEQTFRPVEVLELVQAEVAQGDAVG
jgi:hypothetical protein